jgi:ribulose 1,5-bisphosphate synthetase/thiazole synthase
VSWCLIKHSIHFHAVVLAKDVSMVWCLIKNRIRVNDVVLNQTQDTSSCCGVLIKQRTCFHGVVLN